VRGEGVFAATLSGASLASFTSALNAALATAGVAAWC
jgi:hypothetical protein